MIPTLGSLFSGIGGFDLGFERAGFRTAWQVEIDRAASGVLAYHWPDVTRYGDVCAVSGAAVEPVDVIAFGSPCQDLSVAGQRRGLAGERSGLYFEAIRIIREIRDATNGRRPTFALWENVPGALSSNQGRDFGAAIDALAECGALDIAWRVLDSQWFGLAQRRERVFVVADFRGERAGEILALAQSLRGDSPPRRTAGQDVAPCLEGGANRTGGDRPPGTTVDTATSLIPLLAGTLGGGAQARGWCDDLDRDTFIPQQAIAAGGGNGSVIDVDTLITTGQRYDFESETFVVGGEGVTHSLTAEGADASEDGTGRGTPIVIQSSEYGAKVYDTAPNLRAGRQSCGEYAIAFSHTQGLDCQPDESTFPTERREGGGHAVAFTERSRADGRNLETSDELAYALTDIGSGGNPRSGRLAAGMTVRRLVPVECERLQGFPDSWTRYRADGKEQADGPRYRQLGNAISIPVAEWIARNVIAALRQEAA